MIISQASKQPHRPHRTTGWPSLGVLRAEAVRASSPQGHSVQPAPPLISKPVARSKTPRPWLRMKARARSSSTIGRATRSRLMRSSGSQFEVPQ